VLGCARRDAISKHYRDRIWNDPVRSPLRERNAWWVRARLDADAMASAASALLGEHDFTSFQASGTEITSCVRRMTRAQIGGARSELTLDFEANGFLRYMVRNLVGTLVEVGRGRRSPETMKDVLAACDRGAAGPTAPARGLMLVSVRYP
jgi:tRNA pseudouridine38-40 synthase